MISIINFKAYPGATGTQAVKLAKICEQVARKKKAIIALAVQACDINPVSFNVSIPVLAQHIDVLDQGAHTGRTVPASIKEAGAIGSVINHSEHPISLPMIAQAIKKMRENCMISLVCANSSTMVKKIARFVPDLIAFEPPELIGGKKSVSTTKPEEVRKAVKLARGIPLLCGAGIKTREDVLAAQKLGAQGILISSGVVNAKSPAKALRKLIL